LGSEDCFVGLFGHEAQGGDIVEIASHVEQNSEAYETFLTPNSNWVTMNELVSIAEQLVVLFMDSIAVEGIS
jgi:hypothetical protein